MTIRTDLEIGIGSLIVGLALGAAVAVYVCENARTADKLAAAQHETQAVEAARTVEKDRADTQKGIADEAANERAQALGDQFVALAGADSLRKQVAALQRSASNSASSGDCKASTDAIGMLADVFGQSVERNRRLAADLDAARIAGRECAADYRALTPDDTSPVDGPAAPDAASGVDGRSAGDSPPTSG